MANLINYDRNRCCFWFIKVQNFIKTLVVFFRNLFYHTPFFMKFYYIYMVKTYNYDLFKWLYSYSNVAGQEILTLTLTTRIVVESYLFLQTADLLPRQIWILHPHHNLHHLHFPRRPNLHHFIRKQDPRKLCTLEPWLKLALFSHNILYLILIIWSLLSILTMDIICILSYHLFYQRRRLSYTSLSFSPTC